MSEKQQDKLAPFASLGVELSRSHEQAVGTCPFCYKEDHFFVDPETGKWDCKVCLESGNVITFMTKMVETNIALTTEEDYAYLESLRGIPADELRRQGVCWSGDEWWVPVYGDRGTVRDVRRWVNNEKLYNSSGDLQLWGLRELAKTRTGTTVWVCEGEWDGIALRWLLDLAGRTEDVVVAVPGAGVFKKDWVKWFAGMRTILCYDNDEAGDRGSKTASERLLGTAKEVLFLCWPDSRPAGWDIRDFVLDGRGKDIEAEEAMAILDALVKPRHRRDAPLPQKVATPAEFVEPADFDDVLDTFCKWVKVDTDFHDALAVSLAVAMSNDIAGDPLWLYLIGPPGGGKSLILMSMHRSERCFFRSTLTPASLVSGFNVNPDPSLLPQLNGKTAVFKDGTELLAMHPEARKEAYAVLRGAYDGSVSKSFGNGVKREYELHFTMLVGMTPAVNGDSQSTMGERFLKFQMSEQREDEDKKIAAAIENIGDEVDMQAELSEVVRRFLAKEIAREELPKIPEWAKERTIALSQLLSRLRAQVDRESYGDRDIKYRPTHEVGTRIAKQLVKLGQMLTFVLGTKQIDREVMAIMQRVALDTAVGFHLDVVRALVDRANEGMTRDELSKTIRVPGTTLSRRLQDLEQLGVLRSANVPAGILRTGPVPRRWQLTDYLVQLWEKATGTPLLRADSFRGVFGQYEGSEGGKAQGPTPSNGNAHSRF